MIHYSSSSLYIMRFAKENITSDAGRILPASLVILFFAKRVVTSDAGRILPASLVTTRFAKRNITSDAGRVYGLCCRWHLWHVSSSGLWRVLSSGLWLVLSSGLWHVLSSGIWPLGSLLPDHAYIYICLFICAFIYYLGFFALSPPLLTPSVPLSYCTYMFREIRQKTMFLLAPSEQRGANLRVITVSYFFQFCEHLLKSVKKL